MNGSFKNGMLIKKRSFKNGITDLAWFQSSSNGTLPLFLDNPTPNLLSCLYNKSKTFKFQGYL